MATSSSDESNMAPKDFQLSTSSSDSGSQYSPNKHKCPLCQKFKSNFYCQDCIRNGLFYSSKPSSSEQFLDKQKVFLELQYTTKTAENNCSKSLETKRKADDLHSKIRQAKERSRILKLAVEEKRQKRTLNSVRLKDLKERNAKGNNNLSKYDSKVQEIENYAASRIERLERSREMVMRKQDDIKKLAKIRMQQLFKYIFPIYEIVPTVETTESNDDMVSALAEASQTTYINDRWRYTDYSGEVQYCVVAPTIPQSGNYSAYNVWVAENQDAVPSSTTSLYVERNPAFSISAALTYTAQLIHILAFYLNVRLPYRLSYGDFCGDELAEPKFTRRVARLNANILYLCFSQNVDSHTLRSCETIHNLLQLAENEYADIGRQGPLDVDVQQVDILEEPLSNDLKLSETSDSEDWEAVPRDCPEVTMAGAINTQSPQMTSTQQASSMAGGLVNSAAASIASIWRGFTGR